MPNSPVMTAEVLRFDSYYFGLAPTGVVEIDRILAAIALAGRASHHTDGWSENYFDGPSPAERICDAAEAAAKAFKSRDAARDLAIRAAVVEVLSTYIKTRLDYTKKTLERGISVEVALGALDTMLSANVLQTISKYECWPQPEPALKEPPAPSGEVG